MVEEGTHFPFFPRSFGFILLFEVILLQHLLLTACRRGASSGPLIAIVSQYPVEKMDDAVARM